MKLLTLAAACLAGLSAFAPAFAQDVSLDGRRMLSYGTTAVMVQVCNLPITSSEKTQMMDALKLYADKQTDVSQEAFTEAMKAAGAQIGSNKEAICAQIATQTIAAMLADDEQGK